MTREAYQNLVSKTRLEAGEESRLPAWSGLGKGLGWLPLWPVTAQLSLLATLSQVTRGPMSAVSAIFAFSLVVTIIRDSWDKRIGGVALVVITFHNTHAPKCPPPYQVFVYKRR